MKPTCHLVGGEEEGAAGSTHRRGGRGCAGSSLRQHLSLPRRCSLLPMWGDQRGRAGEGRLRRGRRAADPSPRCCSIRRASAPCIVWLDWRGGGGSEGGR
jgi:hypothetical protein